MASHALLGGAKFQRRDHHGARSAGSPPHASNRAGDYGQALKAFHAASAKTGVTRRVGQFSKAGLGGLRQYDEAATRHRERSVARLRGAGKGRRGGIADLQS